MKELLKDFKAFAVQGNVLDLAVAVIIGGSFGKIVTSFVNDVLMPPIGLLLGNVDFKDLKLMLRAGEPAVTLNYGVFLQTVVDFLIVAMCIFLVIRFLAKLSRENKSKKDEKPLLPSEEEKLLREIRDLLKNKKID